MPRRDDVGDEHRSRVMPLRRRDVAHDLNAMNATARRNLRMRGDAERAHVRHRVTLDRPTEERRKRLRPGVAPDTVVEGDRKRRDENRAHG